MMLKNGIEVDLRKVKAIKKWPRPTIVSKIMSFIGLARYYKWFMKNFS